MPLQSTTFTRREKMVTQTLSKRKSKLHTAWSPLFILFQPDWVPTHYGEIWSAIRRDYTTWTHPITCRQKPRSSNTLKYSLLISLFCPCGFSCQPKKNRATTATVHKDNFFSSLILVSPFLVQLFYYFISNSSCLSLVNGMTWPQKLLFFY